MNSSAFLTDDANKAIAKKLDETGHLFALVKIVHQYPHCWRCKSQFYSAQQSSGFARSTALKTTPLKRSRRSTGFRNGARSVSKGWCATAVTGVFPVSAPGVYRFRILYCKDCGKPIVNDQTIKAISDLFRAEGSDAWYIKEPSEFLPAEVACECGCHEFTKETDIMDVWFDSGVSHAAVIDEREELHFPADLYLEGADQYRGWFQSSLLTSVAYKGVAPRIRTSVPTAGLSMVRAKKCLNRLATV